MAETTTIQGFAPQIAPMAEEAFTEAQNIFQQRMGEGYQRPQTPLFTPFTEPELAAQQQTLNIAAGPLARPAVQEAAGMTRAGASGVGSLIPGLMNPYTQQVADVAKRRFAEDYKRQVINPLMSQSTAADGLRGSRTAVEKALAEERMMEGLSNIDIKLLDEAYKQAAAFGEQQRRRELMAAPEISRLGLVDLGQQLMAPELQASVGEARRGQLDLARQVELGQELAEKQFPETSLQQYLNFLGLGRAPTQTTEYSPDAVGPTGAPQRPTLGQQISTGLSLLASLPKAVSGVSQAVSAVPEVITGVSDGLKGIDAFLRTLAEGGSVGGLSSLPAVRMQEGGRPPNIFAPDMRSEIVRNAYANLLRAQGLQQMQMSPEQKAVAAQNRKMPEQPQMSPGQMADYIDRIQNIQYQRESPLGSLVDLGIGLGTAKMRGDQAAIDSARAARSAKIKSEADMLNTVLGIEDKGIERDRQVVEIAKSAADAFTDSTDLLQAALKEGATPEERNFLQENAKKQYEYAAGFLTEAAKRMSGDSPEFSSFLNNIRNSVANSAQAIDVYPTFGREEASTKKELILDPKSMDPEDIARRVQQRRQNQAGK
jgi:hypothetical protein